jgi:hypothetical protein
VISETNSWLRDFCKKAEYNLRKTKKVRIDSAFPWEWYSRFDPPKYQRGFGGSIRKIRDLFFPSVSEGGRQLA